MGCSLDGPVIHSTLGYVKYCIWRDRLEEDIYIPVGWTGVGLQHLINVLCVSTIHCIYEKITILKKFYYILFKLMK